MMCLSEVREGDMKWVTLQGLLFQSQNFSLKDLPIVNLLLHEESSFSLRRISQLNQNKNEHFPGLGSTLMGREGHFKGPTFKPIQPDNQLKS